MNTFLYTLKTYPGLFLFAPLAIISALSGFGVLSLSISTVAIMFAVAYLIEFAVRRIFAARDVPRS